MNIRQLRAFRAVMETGSISRAAEMLLLSQPAVTKLIQALEAETELRLFLRERQRLLPTVEAHLLMAEAENLFDNMARLDRLAKDLQSLAVSTLSVGAMPSAGISLMPRILTGFQARHEGSSSTLLIRSSPKMTELAIAQQFDVGLSLLPVDNPDVISLPLLRAEAMVILPPGHRLSEHGSVAPEDLRGERFVSLGADDRSVHMIDEVFDQAGVARIIAARVALSVAACEFVRCGAGVTIIDAVTAAGHGADDLLRVPLSPPLHFTVFLLLPTRRPASLIRDRFMDYLHEVLSAGLPHVTYLFAGRPGIG